MTEIGVHHYPFLPVRLLIRDRFPSIDRIGRIRVPLLVISPYAKAGHISHTRYEFSSFLSFMEERWGIEPLTHRDAQANDMFDVFDFDQEPRDPLILQPREEYTTPEFLAQMATMATRTLLTLVDGTLAEFNLAPDAVTLPPSRQIVLQTLAKRADLSSGIVSGRRLDDLRRRTRLPDHVYHAGLHGLEIEVRGARTTHPDLAMAVERMSGLSASLAQLLEEFPDGFHVCGRRRLTGGTADAAGDHRLAMAFAISSGMTPQAGIYTAIIAGFLISALGGSRVQIGGRCQRFTCRGVLAGTRRDEQARNPSACAPGGTP